MTYKVTNQSVVVPKTHGLRQTEIEKALSDPILK